MHTIRIAPTETDVYLADQIKAQLIFDEVAKALQKNDVVLDFQNVRATSPSWMFTLLGNLYLQFPDQFGKQLQLQNLNDSLKNQLDFTVEQAKQLLYEKRVKG
jgi:hypothetical protein